MQTLDSRRFGVVAARTEARPTLPSAREATSLEYRGFSRRLPAALAGLGGALAIPGGLGSWIRTSYGAGPAGAGPSTAFAGASVESGWFLAAIGSAVIAASVLWLRGRVEVQPLVGSALLLAVGAGWRIALLESRTEQLAREAASSQGVGYFQASYGWGAWLLLVAAVLAALGGVAAILREIDARKGLV